MTGKGDVTLTVIDRGLSLRTSNGGVAVFPRIEGGASDFILPSKVTEPIGHFDSMVLAGKMLKAASGKFAPYDWVTVSTANGSGLALTASEGHKYVRTNLDGTLSEPHGFPAESLDGFKALSEPGSILLGEQTIEWVTGGTRLVSVAARNDNGLPNLPFPSREVAKLTFERKLLIEAIKGVAPHDEHNRIQIAANPKDSISDGRTAFVGRYDGADWYGINAVQENAYGMAPVSISATYALELLNNMEGKHVTLLRPLNRNNIIGFASKEMPTWRVLLAPIALS